VRAGLALALVVAGCGGGSSITGSVISASFANLNGANTSGVAISSTFATCDYGATTGGLSCTGSEAANGKGRVVTVSFEGAIVAGMDYPIGGAQHAGVLFTDPTMYGTASGMRLWQAVPGTGAVRVVQWDPGAMHVGFSYYASMQALGSPATGSFDLTGDGNVNTLTSH
jgi:hypothetical protein